MPEADPPEPASSEAAPEPPTVIIGVISAPGTSTELAERIRPDLTERIGARLNLSHATVRSHVQSLLCKLGVHSRAGAVAVAVRSGLITRCA